MRVLVVEDYMPLQESLAQGLREAGFAVDTASDGVGGLWYAQSNDYDVVILDVMLPGMDGLSVLKKLRDGGGNSHVLLLTAKDTVEDRIRGLDLGADDYLVKPFALREFEARARALLRRRTTKGVPELQLGRMRLDLPRRRAQVDGTPLELTPREFGLLEALASRLDRVMSREQLIDALCSWDTTLTDNGLDIAVYRLRRKLDGSGVRIRTVRGLGYLLEAADASA